MFPVEQSRSNANKKEKLMETIREAVACLSRHLLNDPDYRYTWQANIAMAFKDEHFRSENKEDIHEIANNAAKNFLRLLTNHYKDK